MEKHWLCVPDVSSVLLDGPVTGELTDRGNVVDHHGQPFVLVLGAGGAGRRWGWVGLTQSMYQRLTYHFIHIIMTLRTASNIDHLWWQLMSHHTAERECCFQFTASAGKHATDEGLIAQ